MLVGWFEIARSLVPKNEVVTPSFLIGIKELTSTSLLGLVCLKQQCYYSSCAGKAVL